MANLSGSLFGHSSSLWPTLACYLDLIGSLLLSLALNGSLCLALSGSNWLSATLWLTLALSGSLLLSYSAYTPLTWLTRSLLSSHRRCHAEALYLGLGKNDPMILRLPRDESFSHNFDFELL